MGSNGNHFFHRFAIRIRAVTMEEMLRADIVCGSTSEEVLFNSIYSIFLLCGRFGGEGKPDLRQPLLLCQRNTAQRTFSWTKTIHGVILHLATYLEVFITSIWTEGLKWLVGLKINTLWVFRFHFPHSSLVLCGVKVYNLAWHLTVESGWPLLCSVSPLREMLSRFGWTLNSFALSRFLLFVLTSFFLHEEA